MVAIDGSEHSLKAAEYVLEIAKSFGAQLTQLLLLTFLNHII
jgi:nucleotide-binding universal stress UspA family protein